MQVTDIRFPTNFTSDVGEDVEMAIQRLVCIRIVDDQLIVTEILCSYRQPTGILLEPGTIRMS